ncbi:MAG TPA: hypothetical protein VHC69_06810 [Polyangiaceae bacterium]|nr:hypothetical protein [Polyangiaceae bacterium]
MSSPILCDVSEHEGDLLVESYQRRNGKLVLVARVRGPIAQIKGALALVPVLQAAERAHGRPMTP